MRRVLVRVSVAALATAVALAGLAVALPAEATVGGPTCNVPGDYATIAAALADAGCQTINVASGVFTESNLSVTRDVTILGNNASVSPNPSGARSNTTEIDSSDDGFDVGNGPGAPLAGAVTFSGNTITGDDGGEAFDLDGITGALSITGNTITNIKDNDGIEVTDAGAVTINGNTVDGIVSG